MKKQLMMLLTIMVLCLQLPSTSHALPSGLEKMLNIHDPRNLGYVGAYFLPNYRFEHNYKEQKHSVAWDLGWYWYFNFGTIAAIGEPNFTFCSKGVDYRFDAIGRYMWPSNGFGFVADAGGRVASDGSGFVFGGGVHQTMRYVTIAFLIRQYVLFGGTRPNATVFTLDLNTPLNLWKLLE